MNHTHTCKWILEERLLTSGLKPGLLGVQHVHSMEIDKTATDTLKLSY